MKTPLLLLVLAFPLIAREKPNILFITSEDNASHWLGCYGNKQARTPRLDALANEGFLFEHAYSNAPVCAVARATILTGVYAPTLGTQHMRSRHAIPRIYRPNVEYLRANGYYCTNHSKTDYNFKGDDHSYWDASSGSAHYRNRPDGAPFYAVFNIGESHESSLFDDKPAEPQRMKPEQIDLPPYLPDLPEIRKDMARYHDRVTAMDAQVGRILDELEKAGLADRTIVLYCSDHGGVLPRGKRYLEETGVKVPLIVRVPAKFQDLSPFKSGQRVTEPVSFVDLSPTLLSLAGVEIPAQMQGRPFLGSKRVEPAADEMEFLFADRFDELYGMRRGLSDGKWKYIRNFNPDFPTAPYSFYQFGQPGWRAYRVAWENGGLTGMHKALWEAPGSAEQLYDLTADPWETHNLAADPAHAVKLAALRAKLKATMEQTRDTGLVPESLFHDLTRDSTIAEFVQGGGIDIREITGLAFAASEGDAAQLPRFRRALASEDVVERYWGIVGLRVLGGKAAAEAGSLIPLLKDPHAAIRITAGEALFALGRRETAAKALVAEVPGLSEPASLLHLLNILRRLDLLGELPGDWARGKKKKGGDYPFIERFR
ncbi:MAG: sulfatase [Akkermansiaceae bacterium]|jgi:arylsulfatase A-like enzyme|nr:sulfatase [Akkermansiaceae bacterium]